MVNPDVVSLVKGDGVSTPDVLRVDVGDLNVLDNDVLGTVDNAETLALDDTVAAFTNDRLVRGDSDTEGTSGVVSDGVDGGSIGFVVLAPVVLVNGQLAASGSAPRSAATAGGGALGVGEVEAVFLSGI